MQVTYQKIYFNVVHYFLNLKIKHFKMSLTFFSIFASILFFSNTSNGLGPQHCYTNAVRTPAGFITDHHNMIQEFGLSWTSGPTPIAGKCCTKINEPSDPHTWHDNYLCYFCHCQTIFGPITWKFDGPISGQRCISMNEPAEPHNHAWGDNYLCTPDDMWYVFSWSTAGPIPGRECLQISESVDPHTWHDNYLCIQFRG